MGTWIETHPFQLLCSICQVVPLVGTWIETLHGPCASQLEEVVPLVGTWIETLRYLDAPGTMLSFPSWERGLKPCVIMFVT